MSGLEGIHGDHITVGEDNCHASAVARQLPTTVVHPEGAQRVASPNPVCVQPHESIVSKNYRVDSVVFFFQRLSAQPNGGLPGCVWGLHCVFGILIPSVVDEPCVQSVNGRQSPHCSGPRREPGCQRTVSVDSSGSCGRPVIQRMLLLAEQGQRLWNICIAPSQPISRRQPFN